MATPELSVVIPVYNEEGNILPLTQELTSVLAQLKKPYEIIYIDDGSRDRTFQELLTVAKDPHVKYIRFTKNFQKAAALNAGFHYAKGTIIITMDGDLQEDPHDIPRFLEKLQTCDVVVGWKYNRRDSLPRGISSKIFNSLIRRLIGIRIHDSDCNYKAIRKHVLTNITLYSGLYRYIPVLAANKGYRIDEIKVNHRQRYKGKSKYGVRRLFSGVLDLFTIKFLTSYTKKPLHFFGMIGIFSMFAGVLIGIYLLYVKLVQNLNIGNRPLLILSLLLVVVGVQLLSLGLVGELITSYNQQPTEQYLIRETNL